jgi:hypothetical protein
LELTAPHKEASSSVSLYSPEPNEKHGLIRQQILEIYASIMRTLPAAS